MLYLQNVLSAACSKHRLEWSLPSIHLSICEDDLDDLSQQAKRLLSFTKGEERQFGIYHTLLLLILDEMVLPHPNQTLGNFCQLVILHLLQVKIGGSLWFGSLLVDRGRWNGLVHLKLRKTFLVRCWTTSSVSIIYLHRIVIVFESCMFQVSLNSLHCFWKLYVPGFWKLYVPSVCPFIKLASL